MDSSKLFLGIDPGSSKTGLALVCRNGAICDLKIVPTDNLEGELLDFCQGKEILAIILGNGTHSKKISQVVGTALPDIRQCFVDEAYSTEEARKLYWEVNPPSGLKKILPMGLLVPPEPLDAYAAVIQVRRWLAVCK